MSTYTSFPMTKTLGAALFAATLLASAACNQDPNFETRAPILPDATPEDSASIADGWHWIHPYPTPYSLRELQPSVGGAVAVGRIAYREGGDVQDTWQPVALEEDYSIPSLPLNVSHGNTPRDENPFGNGLLDLTPTHRGWLALSAVGVYDFDARGNIESSTIPATVTGPGLISGKSSDTFAAFQTDFSGGFVYRDGEGTRYTDIGAKSGSTRALRMWPDGTIWEVAEGDDPRERWMSDNWRGFPALPEDERSYYYHIGPGPSSGCSDAGIWATGSTGLHRWEQGSRQWVLSDYDGPRVTSINCDHLGHPLVTDEDGGFSRLVDGDWRRRKVDDRALRSAAPAGLDSPTKTYITGDDGMVAELSGGEVTQVTGGFRLPERLETGISTYRRAYSDIWLNAGGSRAVLLHQSGFYHGSGGRWTSKPHEDTLGIDREWDEVWGVKEPKFAIIKSQLRRWDGSQWIETELGPFRQAEEGARDLAGTSNDEVWFATNDTLFRYDGTSWSTLIQDQTLDISALWVGDDGTVLAAERGRIHAVGRADGEWQLTELTETPCGDIQSFVRDDGELWVAGQPNCIAKKDPEGWVNFPFGLVANPGQRENGSKTFVRQPGDRPPLVVTEGGIAEPTGDGTLRTIITGQFTGGQYLPERNISVILHQHGVLAKYHGD